MPALGTPCFLGNLFFLNLSYLYTLLAMIPVEFQSTENVNRHGRVPAAHRWISFTSRLALPYRFPWSGGSYQLLAQCCDVTQIFIEVIQINCKLTMVVATCGLDTAPPVAAARGRPAVSVYMLSADRRPTISSLFFPVRLTWRGRSL